MEFSTRTGSLAELDVDAIIFTADANNQPDEAGGSVNQAMDQRLSDALKAVGFTGKPGTTCVLPGYGQVAARRIVVAGIGDRSETTIDGIRTAWGAAARAARDAGATTIASSSPSSATELRAAAEGVHLGLYRHDIYRTEQSSPGEIASVAFVNAPDGAESAFKAARQMSAGVSLARDLVNTPGLDLYPDRLAGRAWEMADSHGLECTVYDRAALAEMGAGAIIGVGQGSYREPRLIHLVYRPEGQSIGTAGFVGKAITFDTGGVNLKTADGMRNMKMDMAGGAAVIGAMRAVAGLKPPFVVHGVVAAAENMPSHTAYRPGDVLKTLSGKTVEITNTDAEGRLVLADALTFTARQGAEFMIDLATLTGASIVSVGAQAASLFGSDDVTADLLKAADYSGELMWRMPLWDAYRSDLNSDIADILNSGGRDGGAIKAALFLKEFTHDVPWAHLDIAGPAWSTKVQGYRIKCATGYGVHTLATLLEQRAAAS